MGFDINQIYKAQFGTVGDPLPTGGQVPAQGSVIRCPLTMAVDGTSFKFPFEPLISIFGKNTIIRNHILKGRSKGTVKEYWSADDYTIEIKGIVIGKDMDRLPQADLDKIRFFCEARKAIEVSSPFLTLYNVQFIAIETFEFIHTPGYNNQAYVIKGYSDEAFELF